MAVTFSFIVILYCTAFDGFVIDITFILFYKFGFKGICYQLAYLALDQFHRFVRTFVHKRIDRKEVNILLVAELYILIAAEALCKFVDGK